MSISETVLVFVGGPAVITAVIAVLVYAGSARKARRYRPGRPYEFTPVWFLAAPAEQGPEATAPALAGPARAALTGTRPAAVPAGPGPTGGASDRW